MQRTAILKLILTIILVAAFLGAVVLGIYVFKGLQPADSGNETTQRFVVAPGSGVQQIANNLHSNDLIRNPYIFRLYVTINDLDSQLQAGSFELSPSMEVAEIATILTEGTQDTWVTILEGWRVEEIAEYLDSKELTVFNSAEFIEIAAPDEGRLYPDTYLVPKDITTQAMHNLLLNTFEVKVLDELSTEIAASEREFSDILIMASLVEREARDYEQMRHVAGILWNRIDIGMPLQVDATLQYARGYDSGNDSWWSPPSATDKAINSRYNTYTNLGLPPTPIANPSQNAIRAALDPLAVNDLFYLHASDGQMYYAETIEEHNANVNAYLR